MEKTVQVVDEAGIRYEATYLRRAKGLVKHGRARFIDENTICLACPPNKINLNSEDRNMMNIENFNSTKEIETKQANTDNEKTAIRAEGAAAKTTPKYSLEYALEQIEKIGSEISVVLKALDVISGMESEATLERGGSADEMAKAAADIVRCRETTNQKLIAFYEKMADDCKPPQGQAKRDEEFLTTLLDYLSSPKSGVNESEAELFRNFIKNC